MTVTLSTWRQPRWFQEIHCPGLERLPPPCHGALVPRENHEFAGAGLGYKSTWATVQIDMARASLKLAHQ
ncbi:hypothetical protein CDEST_00346 [Colletotrichum destructivum]|uniref:Uncharacterized protein n=1 Tax=Colletotrichum destructivum TaxID=34406 RepID=A0AAX4HX44_9PEZI|nr:hypothetical protein CDEST_00346 [Colletotrichum destructivum]